VAEFTYDGTQANNAIGRLISEWDGPSGSADKTDYTYDQVGRVLTANRTISSTAYAMSYAYDLMGNLTSMNYPSSSGTRRKVDYAYTTTGDLNKATDTTGTAFDYVTAAQYAPLGTLQQLDLGNSVRTTVGWNKRGFSTSLLTQKVGGSSYLQLTYSHFNNGQIQQIVNNLVTNQTQDEKYTYDELRRLLTAQRGPDTSVQRKYTYDIDRYGNRWAQTVSAGSGYGGTNSFDSANNRATSSGFTYDNSGNVTASGSGTSFGYNPESFLTSASVTGVGSGTYVRDAEGRRVRKTVGSTVTEYFYSGSELIAEKTGSVWTDYVFFGGLRVAQVVKDGTNPEVITYLHTDHLGSVRRCTDSNGNQNGTCDYEPFGEYQPPSQTTCSALPTNLRFAGMQYDSESQLYHTWFRAYDPNQARWLSVDPVAGSVDEPQSVNLYVYVLNDPVNLTDPMGLCTEFACISGWQFIGGQLVNCSVDGLWMDCGEFAAWGFLNRLIREGLEGDWLCRGGDCNWRVSPLFFGLSYLVNLQQKLQSQRTRCEGNAEFSAVGPSQATGPGALAGFGIKGHTPGGVAVDPRVFGFSYPSGNSRADIRQRVASQRALAAVASQISIAPQGLNLPAGGPAPPYTVTDVGDVNIRRAGRIPRFDIYGFPSDQAARQFGRQTAKTIITVPGRMSCPTGFKQLP
jgi:RHS repeat-associated protein